MTYEWEKRHVDIKTIIIENIRQSPYSAEMKEKIIEITNSLYSTADPMVTDQLILELIEYGLQGIDTYNDNVFDGFKATVLNMFDVNIQKKREQRKNERNT